MPQEQLLGEGRSYPGWSLLLGPQLGVGMAIKVIPQPRPHHHPALHQHGRRQLWESLHHHGCRHQWDPLHHHGRLHLWDPSIHPATARCHQAPRSVHFNLPWQGCPLFLLGPTQDTVSPVQHMLGFSPALSWPPHHPGLSMSPQSLDLSAEVCGEPCRDSSSTSTSFTWQHRNAAPPQSERPQSRMHVSTAAPPTTFGSLL